MADRYLLESSSVDGYLLEDSSGVLLLDAPPPLTPDGGEDSGAWGLFQSAVIGTVVAAAMALSAGNARSATVTHQDEYPYATGNGIIYGQPYTSRAQVKPVFIQMSSGDDIVPQAAPSPSLDESLFDPTIIRNEVSLPGAWPDETIPRILVEESEWDSPLVVPQIPVAPVWGDQEDLPITPAGSIVEESEYVGSSVISLPALEVWNAQDEITTAPPPFTPMEEDWDFSRLRLDDVDGIIWVTDDDIAPAFAVEEIGWRAEWLIPKPFTEVFQTQEDRPTPVVATEGGGGVVYDEISIFRWYQEDPLPVTATPLGIDEEPWKPPVLSLEGPKWLDSPDELIVPQPAPTIREDDYWLGCPTFLPEAIRAVWDSQDEIPPSIRDEEPWMGASYPLGPVVQVSDYSDDIVPQPPTAISVEETYWIQPDPPRGVVTSWQFSIEVNEDFPELRPGPPLVVTPEVTGGWPMYYGRIRKPRIEQVTKTVTEIQEDIQQAKNRLEAKKELRRQEKRAKYVTEEIRQILDEQDRLKLSIEALRLQLKQAGMEEEEILLILALAG